MPFLTRKFGFSQRLVYYYPFAILFQRWHFMFHIGFNRWTGRQSMQEFQNSKNDPCQKTISHMDRDPSLHCVNL